MTSADISIAGLLPLLSLDVIKEIDRQLTTERNILRTKAWDGPLTYPDSAVLETLEHVTQEIDDYRRNY